MINEWQIVLILVTIGNLIIDSPGLYMWLEGRKFQARLELAVCHANINNCKLINRVKVGRIQPLPEKRIMRLASASSDEFQMAYRKFDQMFGVVNKTFDEKPASAQIQADDEEVDYNRVKINSPIAKMMMIHRILDGEFGNLTEFNLKEVVDQPDAQQEQEERNEGEEPATREEQF